MRQMRVDPVTGTLSVQSCPPLASCSTDDGDSFVLEDLVFSSP